TSFIGILIIAQPSVLVNRFCKVLLAVSSVRRISPGSSAGCGRCSCPPRQNENPRGSHLRGFDFREAGIYLFSQAVSSQLSSAQVSLTSVFGIGTGWASPSSTPAVRT